MKVSEKYSVAAVAAAIMLTVSIASMVSLITQKQALIHHGVQVEAVITKVSSSTAKRNTPSMHTVDYTFRTHTDRQIQVTNHYIPSDMTRQLSKGKILSVTYLESDPVKNEPTTTLHTLWYFYVFFPLYIVILVALAFLARRPIRRIFKQPWVVRMRATWWGGLVVVASTLVATGIAVVFVVNAVYFVVEGGIARLAL